MSAPFLLEIPPRGMIEEIGQHSRVQVIGYYGDPERRHALSAAIGCLEAYTSERTAMEMATALESAPELCALASVVHTILGSRQMDASDALAALQAIRSSTNPEWARAIAGREIIAQDLAHAGQHAVCDASEVDYSAEYPEIGDFRRDCGTCAAYQDKGREHLHQCDDCETDAQQKWSPCEAVRNAKCDASEVVG